MKQRLNLTLFACLAIAGMAPLVHSDTVAYQGATLVDGTGAPAVRNSVLVVRDGRFAAAGAGDAVKAPPGARVVDASGKWIVPGLVDAHVHFMESGRIYTKPGSYDLTHLVPYEEEVAWMQARVPVTLRGYLCAGVTTAVSVGGPKFEYEVRSAAAKMPDAPNVFVGHGPVTLVPWQQLFPLFDGDTSVRTVSDGPSARAAIQQAADWGADLVKTGYLGGPFAEHERDHLAMHRAIVDEAARHGLPVTTHVTELEAARDLVELGVSSLQHVPLDAPLDDAFVQSVRQQGVIVVPTLAVFPRSFVEVLEGTIQLEPIEKQCGDPQVIRSWTEVEDLPSLSPEMIKMSAGFVELAKTNAAQLYAAGIPLAAGSDAGNSGLVHGASLHYELKLMAGIGMTPMDLLSAATLTAAQVAGQADEVGSIEAGKQADFLVLNADPLADIANLQDIAWVIKAGHRFAQRELVAALQAP